MNDKGKSFLWVQTLFNAYLINATVGNTDAKAIIYRDIIMNIFYVLLFGLTSDRLNKYINDIQSDNIYDVLEKIIINENWEQLKYED